MDYLAARKYAESELEKLLQVDEHSSNGKRILEFGRGMFYQSFPLIGLSGQRPTDKRIDCYGLIKYLSASKDVLDIGCNVGFLDLQLSQYVRSVTGIEYNKELVRIGTDISRMLNIENVDFVNDDFLLWNKRCNKKFDVIFSFAVHYWLHVTPRIYTQIVSSLIKKNGILVIESQNINTVDNCFYKYVEQLIHAGFCIMDEGTIQDDGIIGREWVVLQKRS